MDGGGNRGISVLVFASIPLSILEDYQYVQINSAI